MLSLAGILETALYVEDLERSKQFYRTLFDLETLVEDERLCALRVAGRQVLLLFRKGGSLEPAVLPGGTIPPHDGHGSLHMAFSIATSDWEGWLGRMRAQHVAVESIVSWPRGGRSLYFRDPDNHLIELGTPGVWSIY
jgi:catechol 2,3-dioxygenase-like lactoylglutathione lyase family enzyme